MATASLLFTACSTANSSFHYTKGTEYLDQCNYPEAIYELQQAVDLDPAMARNHTNLSVAYRSYNNYDAAWYHCRQAVRSPYDDGLCKMQFAEYCHLLIIKPGLNRPGTSVIDIFSKLGFPDDVSEDENHQIVHCTYGLCEMSFENSLLTKFVIKQ